MKTHNEDFKYKCDWCPSTFYNEMDLKIHLKNHKYYKCDKCEKQFVWKSKLKKHNCSVGIYNDFKFLSAKRKHIKTVKRVWLCNFCDKYYPDLRDIYDHTIYNHILISPNKIME